jgi:hypothetical protein
MSNATIVIVLDLDEPADCPHGTATAAGGESRDFHGWLGLAAAIEALTRTGHGATGAPAFAHTADQGEKP